MRRTLLPVIGAILVVALLSAVLADCADRRVGAAHPHLVGIESAPDATNQLPSSSDDGRDEADHP
jgi:hypothetical protein